MIHYSDLLLSKATQERARSAQQIAAFLALVNKNRELLLDQLKATSQLSENCLVLSKVYHQDVTSLLQNLASDLTQQHECLIAPLTKEQLNETSVISAECVRKAQTFDRVIEQLGQLQTVVEQIASYH